MINLKSTSLVAIDGKGDDLNTIKALSYSCKDVKFEEIKYINCGDKKINFGETIKINQLNWNDYNKFCLVNLCEYVNTDYVILIQNDGFIINSNKWNDLFFSYDYLGAPWPIQNLRVNLPRWPIVLQKHFTNKQIYQIGNGGFTLRSKKLLNKTKELYTDEVYSIPEDILISIYFREKMEDDGLHFCNDIDFAETFSCEALFVNGKEYSSDNSFGFHCKETHKDKIALLNTL